MNARLRPLFSGLGVAVLLSLAPASLAAAQPAAAPSPAPTNPRQVQAERPTVATHAFAVAPGYVEVETGWQHQPQNPSSGLTSVPALFKIGLTRTLQLDVASGWQRTTGDGDAVSGITDSVIGLKWQVIEDSAALGAFALQGLVLLPTGSFERRIGTGEAGVNLLAISSRSLGPVALDLNVGYTRRGGDGTSAPKNSTVWAVSTGFPLAGRVGMVAELFGLPGTSGPAGDPAVVGFLTGPTFEIGPSFVLDAGAIFNVSGWGDTAIYAGLTWNLGRAWGARPSPHATTAWPAR